MKTMKKMITLIAVAGLVLALAPAAQAQTIIMDPTTNDGSFESQVSGYTQAPMTSPSGVWVITINQGGNCGGMGTNPGLSSDGENMLFCNARQGAVPDANVYTTTTTSINLLGTTSYATVAVGDVFSWSLDVRPQAIGNPVTFAFDFGTGAVGVLSTASTTSGSYVTY